MKKLLLFVLFDLTSWFSVILAAQGNPEVSWVKALQGLKDDAVNQIIPSTDGGYYVLGSTQSPDGDFKFCYTCGTYVSRGFVMKLDYEGKIIWSRIPIGDDSKKDIISNGWYAGVEVNDGIVAVGYSNSGPNNIQDNNYHIVKMNKFTGEIIWRRNIGDFVFDFYGHDGFAIVATSEGFLVASRSAANYKNLVLVRLSHEGAEIGRRIIENFRFQSEPILQLNRGDKTESITNFSYKDVRNVHNFIQKTSDNNYIICGVTEVNEPDNKCFIIPSDLRVIKFNTSLNTIWDKNYSSPTVDEPLDMILLQSNEIVILGTSCGEANEPKGPFNINNYSWMLKLNSTGDFKAIEGIDEYSQFAQIVTLGMNLSCDNKILISGKTYSASGIIPWIRKKELDMKTNLWFSNLDYYNIAQINDIVLDKSNNIIGWGRANLGEDDVFIGKLKTECGSSGRCQKALPIQCGQTISGTTVGAVSSFDKTDYTCHSTSSPFDGGDVVYEFVMNNGTGNLDISLVSNTDLDIFLFDRCDATGLNCIAKSTYPTRPSGSNAELIRYYDLPNGTYYIVIDGARTSNNGIYELTVTCGVLNCLNSKMLSCNQAITESNADGINNASSYCGIKNTAGSLNGFAGRGKEKVYQFSINQTQTVKVDLTGMSSGSDFDLYILSDCDPDKCVASSFNAGTQNETVSPILNPGVYYAVVESYYDKVGSYTIKASCTAGGGTIPRPRIVMATGLVGETGQELRYPITASNFKNMAAMEFSVKVNDPSILNIIGVEGKAITPAYNLVSSSNIGLSWFSSNQPTVTVSDGEVLFNLILKIKAISGSTVISITDKPTIPYGLVNNNGVLQTVSLELGDGLVTVNENLVQLCGEITKEDGSPINEVILDLSGSKSESTVNQISGNYCFVSLPKSGSFSLKPKKNTNYRNGLNGRDLYLIQRHILGEKIISPYRIIAGDYNGDNLINGRDLYLTQRLILGDSTTLPISSWRFIPKAHKFSDYTNPFIGNFSDKIDLNNLGQSAIGQDFIGVKVGDVDNTSTSLMNELSSRSGTPLNLSLSKHTAQPNSLVNISLTASGFQNITSLDYTLQWDTTIIQFINFEAPSNNPLGLSSGNFEAKTSPGKLISTWFDSGTGKTINDGTVIAKFVYQVKGSLGKNTPIQFVNTPVPLLAYDRSGKIQVDTVSGRVEIANVNSIASNGIHPFRINANPVHDQIIIEYHDILTSDVEVHLYDLSGKEVTINVDNENQRIKINVKEICNGMYLLKLNGNGKNSVMKIFIQH